MPPGAPPKRRCRTPTQSAHTESKTKATKARRVGRGSDNTVMDGPSTAQQVFNWPTDILSRALDGGEEAATRKERLQDMIDNVEVQMNSDYSGMDCPSEALRCMFEGLRGMFPAWTITNVRLLRSCDSSPLCRDVLMANHYATAQLQDTMPCLFDDICSRLDAEAQRVVRYLEPLPGASAEAARRAREKQAEYISIHKCRLFKATTTVYCRAHDRQCPAYPHPKPLKPGPVLRMNISGTICQGWSTLRSGCNQPGKFAHPSELPHSVWKEERSRTATMGLEDLFIQECTAKYAWIAKLGSLQDTHVLRRLLIGPELLGFPCRRWRSFVIGVSRKRLVWEGPEQRDVQEHFDILFRRKIVATGNVFLNASEDEVAEEMRRKAAIQKHFWPADMDVGEAIRQAVLCKADCDALMREVLGIGSFVRFMKADACRAESDPNGPFFSDTNQNIEFTSASDLLPCEVRHGTIVCHHAGRIATPLELMSSHGWHVHQGVTGDWGLTPRYGTITNLKPSERSSLAGNGMNLPSVEAVVLYALSHLRWKHETVPEVVVGFGRGATSFFDTWVPSDDEKIEQGSAGQCQHGVQQPAAASSSSDRAANRDTEGDIE